MKEAKRRIAIYPSWEVGEPPTELQNTATVGPEVFAIEDGKVTRGTAYVVFTEVDIAAYEDVIPNFVFWRPPRRFGRARHTIPR